MIYRQDQQLGIDPITLTLIAGALIKAGQSGYEYYQSDILNKGTQAQYKEYIVAKGMQEFQNKNSPEKSALQKALPIVAVAGGGLIGLMLLIKA